MSSYWRSAPIRRLRHPVEESVVWGFLGGALWGAIALVIGAPFLTILLLALPVCFVAQWATRPKAAVATVSPYDRRWLGTSWRNSVLHAILVLEPRPDIKNLQNLIATKVIPSYPCLARIPDGNYWFPDLKFNIEHHVFTVPLNLPSEHHVQEYISRLLSEGLRKDKPPWELQILNHHAVLRVHQSLSDGKQLVRVLCRALANCHVNSIPFTSTTFLYQIINACILGPLSLLCCFFLSLQDLNIFTRKDVWTGESSVALSSKISVPQVMHIKAVTRSTANCVLLSALAGSLRIILQGCGIAQPPNLHVVVPASIGRWTAPVTMTLPVGVEGAIPRLWATRNALQRLRQSARPAMFYLAAVALLATSSGLARNFLATITGKASLQFSSMKGPGGIMKVDGTSVLGMYPFLPAPTGLGMSVTAIFYSDRLFVTVVADSSLDPAANLLLHHLNCQVVQMYELLLNRRVPGESRAHLLLRRADVTGSPTRELRLRLHTVQEEVTHQLTAGFESERIQTLKLEFSHLLCELRRRKSLVGDDSSAFEDEEIEGGLWQPQQRRAVSCTALRRPNRLTAPPARPTSYVEPRRNNTSHHRTNRPLSCSDSDMYYYSPTLARPQHNTESSSRPCPTELNCSTCSSQHFSPEASTSIENGTMKHFVHLFTPLDSTDEVSSSSDPLSCSNFADDKDVICRDHTFVNVTQQKSDSDTSIIQIEPISFSDNFEYKINTISKAVSSNEACASVNNLESSCDVSSSKHVCRPSGSVNSVYVEQVGYLSSTSDSSRSRDEVDFHVRSSTVSPITYFQLVDEDDVIHYDAHYSHCSLSNSPDIKHESLSQADVPSNSSHQDFNPSPSSTSSEHSSNKSIATITECTT